MSDWDWENEYAPPDLPLESKQELDENGLTQQQRYCYHEWVSVLLLTTYVFDCKKCRVHKEKIK